MSTFEKLIFDVKNELPDVDKLLLASVDFFVDEKFRLVTKVSYPSHYETHFPLFMHSLNEKMKQFYTQLIPPFEKDLQSVFQKMDSEM